MSRKYVIFDCDGGSDDAWALLLLLKADEEKRLVILGITIVGCGNTNLECAALNMRRVLKTCNRQEIPIFLGAAEPLIDVPNKEIGFLFHGKDGFGDVLPPQEGELQYQVERENAINFLYKFCVQNPNKITVIAVGPLTNIALCYATFGQKFADSIKELYIMGGNHEGIGNSTPHAEFNFYCDPEAAHIVFARSKCPITVLPWEPCMPERFSIDIDWRLESFGVEAARNNATIDMLNVVERAQWCPNGFKTWNPCDALLVAAFLFDKNIVLKENATWATVDVNHTSTRGRMMLGNATFHQQQPTQLPFSQLLKPKNVRILEMLDPEFFKQVAQWAAGTKCMH